jgi:hypothetical protein
MSTVNTTTAPDFLCVREDVPRLAPVPGVRLELLVLTATPSYCVGVDVETGVLVKAWCSEPDVGHLRPYDLAAVVIADGPAPEPTEPEGILIDAAPEAVGRLTGRRAERLLRPLLHPVDAPLLSSHGPAVPFWERRADHPSVALVEPLGPIGFLRDDPYLTCRFVWQEKLREMPCIDRRVAGEMDQVGERYCSAPKGARLLVALSAPIEGHCHKVVEAVVPRA